MKDAILDAAEQRIRANGYHGFSFRQIAGDVGIKSASVHYHFPTKSDLVAATARRYTERFLEFLGDPIDARSANEKLALLVSAFRRAMTDDGLMCLCGTLGAQVSGVPESVGVCTRDFFVALHAWVEKVAINGRFENPAGKAMHILATLEGALLVARTLDSARAFDQAVGDLRVSIESR